METWNNIEDGKDMGLGLLGTKAHHFRYHAMTEFCKMGIHNRCVGILFWESNRFNPDSWFNKVQRQNLSLGDIPDTNIVELYSLLRYLI